MGRNQFGTFMIIAPTSFFLGILFTNLPFDYPTLWTTHPPTESVLRTIESHYSHISLSPPLIPRVLNAMIILGLTGFLAKLALYSPSESNYLFDGASLILYLIALVMYGTNLVQGVDTLKVMGATQTMMALVLLGVLVLQAGQWYAEWKEAEEEKRIEKEQKDGREKEGGKKCKKV
ncbi:Shr3 amino acid permease chaperone [Terfezia claveryi]|nr:Shr3 amino acid permease chaperone [Terfezia claveryi]